MGDAQKAYRGLHNEDDGERVYILETIEELDSESDSFGQRLRQLSGQPSTKELGEPSKQLWFMTET